MKLPEIIVIGGIECDILIGVNLKERAFAMLCRKGITILEFEDTTIRKVKSRMRKWLIDNKFI